MQSLQYCYGVITGFRRIDQWLYLSPFVNGATTEVECLESGTAQIPNSWKSYVTGKSYWVTGTIYYQIDADFI